ncbi:MAG TPA: Gfo/Idh/MocA family oxidoreductase, partial [Candidatus Limnocylindria bacterium]|nr:Gfo/Idh/MocA family oxidoreductase [Candidatus Limnocylindria bacterium]
MVKVGIIGCGKIAQVRHAPEYLANPDCKIIATYDRMPERAADLARRCGAKAYDSVEGLLASGVDAVSVCVHNVAHAETSIQALRAGAHVLCEKPMATTLQDCEEMARVARETGRTLMIGHNQRYSQTHHMARDLIREGAIGTPIAFRLAFCHPGPEEWTGLSHSWFF